MPACHPPHADFAQLQNRRAWLTSGLGFGSVALHAMLSADSRAETRAREPAEHHVSPHSTPQATSVIWLFMRGGLSHMESFDPKPALNKYAGLTINESPFAHVQDPERLKKVRVVVVNDANGQQRNRLYPLQVGFRRCGQSGLSVSNWFPHIGGCADDLAVVRSMWTTDDNHGAQVQFHSGRHMLDPRVPTIGAWVTWGLGTLNENLPQFIAMGPRFFDRRDGHYLGPAYDSVPLKVDPSNPLDYAQPELPLQREEQRLSFDLIRRLNQLSAGRYPDDAELTARMKSYELAFRMQTAIPEAMTFAAETQKTQQLYGFDQEETRPFGQQLLAARRLVERGVRFIQIQHGNGAAGAWDQHSGLKAGHAKLARQVDRPVAGLLTDLKRRGLLDRTLVVFATEFGRTPGSQGSDGRDHHPYGFSIWMAGGGLKGGVVEGATDEIGFHAVEQPHYVTDVHATILKQLGLEPESMQIPGHKRLEQDFGHAIESLVA